MEPHYPPAKHYPLLPTTEPMLDPTCHSPLDPLTFTLLVQPALGALLKLNTVQD